MSRQLELGVTAPPAAKHISAEGEHNVDIEACPEALEYMEAAGTEVAPPKPAGSASLDDVEPRLEALKDMEAARTEVAPPKPAGSASLDCIMARLEALEAARTEVAPPNPAGSASLDEIKARLEALEAARTEVAPAPPNPSKIAQEKAEVVWAFVGNLYCVFAVQFFVSAGIAILFFKLPCILHYFETRTVISWGIYISVLLTVPIVWYAMLKYRKMSPYNIALLGVFNVSANVTIHLLIPSKGGNLMVLIALLSTAASISLIMFSVWARLTSFKLSFGVPALVGGITVLTTYAITTLLNPMGILSSNPYSLIFSLFISSVMVYEVNKSTETHTREEVFVASIDVYVQLLNEVASRASFSLI